MYLQHFKFKDAPFCLTPNTALFCNLKGHSEALNVLLFGLRSGEGFIKIIGEVGSGKTLLCRRLLTLLDDGFRVAYLPNPDLTPLELRRALARELGIDLSTVHDTPELVTIINNHLLALHQAGKKVVLLIDEAQALPLESLETLRLLTNLETEKSKLLQVVLFAQPELDERLSKPNLRQLAQRITFSYYLPLMSREELDMYLYHRLTTVGCSGELIFMKRARDTLYKASKGVPRLVNILCHKALLAAYGKGALRVTQQMMRAAINDTMVISIKPMRIKCLFILSALLLLVIGCLMYL